MVFSGKDDKYIHSIRIYNFMEDGISIIYEKRDLDGKIIEVWHLTLSNEGKLVHKHRKSQTVEGTLWDIFDIR